MEQHGAEQRGQTVRPDGVALAWSRVPGRGPTVVFIGGYRSDMSGTKAGHLAAWAARTGRAFLRFDLSGTGASGGNWTDGTIGRWLADSRLVIADAAPGPVVLVGSSMGGWLALLLAVRGGMDVRALVGIAAAPDFTEDLMWAAMAPAERATLARDGVLHVPSDYGDPVPVTHALVADGRDHLLLRAPIPFAGPVCLLQGQRDAEVPWETALRVAERLAGGDVRVVLVKDGDHRLSRPADLRLLTATLDALLGDQDGA